MSGQLLYPTTVNAVSKQLNANYTNADAVITLTNTTSIQNKPGVCLINRIDVNGTLQSVASWTYIEFTATSGATLTGCTVISGGQDQALGKVVEFISDVTQQQRILDALANLVVPATGAIDTTKVLGVETPILTKQTATPANPASGYNKIYFKSDDKAYTLTSAGVEAEVGSGSGAETEVFIIAGTFPSAATTNLSKTWYAPAACTMTKVDLYVSTAGSGANTTYVDVNKNATTIFSTQGNRPALTTTGTSSVDKVPDVTSLAKGDAVTIDVDAITAVAPSDGYILIHYTRD